VEAERYIEVLVVRHCDNAEVPLLPVVGNHAVRCEAEVRRGNAAEVSTKAGSINNIPALDTIAYRVQNLRTILLTDRQ
jgi:hypothetical protein